VRIDQNQRALLRAALHHVLRQPKQQARFPAAGLGDGQQVPAK
jgi:hypothetical protein